MPWENNTFYENYLSDDGETLRVDPAFIHWFRLVHRKHGLVQWAHGNEEDRWLRCTLGDFAKCIVSAYLRSQPYASSDDCLHFLNDVSNSLMAPGGEAKMNVTIYSKTNKRKMPLPDATPQVEYSKFGRFQ